MVQEDEDRRGSDEAITQGYSAEIENNSDESLLTNKKKKKAKD